MTAQEIMDLFSLNPLPREGGYFRRVYLGGDVVSGASLPGRYGRDKVLGSSVLYLITPESWSSLHRLQGDEIWHLCMGGPAEQLLLYPDGTCQVRILGSTSESGGLPVSVVPHGVWQGTRLTSGASFALFGVTMPLAYDDEDVTFAGTEELISLYPQCRDMIAAFRQHEGDDFL